VKAENEAMEELVQAGEDIAELVRLTALFTRQVKQKFDEAKGICRFDESEIKEPARRTTS